MPTQRDGAINPIAMDVDTIRKSMDFDQDDLEAEKLGITPGYKQDAFGNEEFAEVKYKVLKWWYVPDILVHCFCTNQVYFPGNVDCVRDRYSQALRDETNKFPVLIAETVSLGVLSLPAAIAGLGLVPYVFRRCCMCDS